jgi:mono/diheme cytochrome c family protein
MVSSSSVGVARHWQFFSQGDGRHSGDAPREETMSRADLAGRIDTVEHRMDSIEHRLDASFAAFSTQILQSNRETRDAILATLRSEMETMGGTLRDEIAAMGSSLRSEMETMGGTLRDEIAAMGSSLRSEMETMGGTLRDEIAAMGSSLRSEMETMGGTLRDEMYALHGITVCRFERLETALADGLGETRRFMKVLHEDTLSRIALLAEGRPPS